LWGISNILNPYSMHACPPFARLNGNAGFGSLLILGFSHVWAASTWDLPRHCSAMCEPWLSNEWLAHVWSFHPKKERQASLPRYLEYLLVYGGHDHEDDSQLHLLRPGHYGSQSTLFRWSFPSDVRPRETECESILYYGYYQIIY